MNITFREIERMYRRHEINKTKYSTLNPKMTQVITDMPIYHSGESTTEKMAIEKARLSHEIKLIQKLLTQMTHDERLFIHYRYFSDKPMEIIPSLMNWERTKIFKLRLSVLSKSKYVIDIDKPG